MVLSNIPGRRKSSGKIISLSKKLYNKLSAFLHKKASDENVVFAYSEILPDALVALVSRIGNKKDKLYYHLKNSILHIYIISNRYIWAQTWTTNLLAILYLAIIQNPTNEKVYTDNFDFRHNDPLLWTKSF